MRTHHVQVQLPDAVALEQRRERVHRLEIRLYDAHVDGGALLLRAQMLHRLHDAIEGAGLLRRALVRQLVRALDRDAPREVAAERDDLVHEALAGRLHAVREQHDLLETEGDRVPHHVLEAGLQRRLAAQNRELPVPALERLRHAIEQRLDGQRPRAPERRLLPADAEDATVVAHVAELDLDLRLRLHPSSSYRARARSSIRRVSCRSGAESRGARCSRGSTWKRRPIASPSAPEKSPHLGFHRKIGRAEGFQGFGVFGCEPSQAVPQGGDVEVDEQTNW